MDHCSIAEEPDARAICAHSGCPFGDGAGPRAEDADFSRHSIGGFYHEYVPRQYGE
ncbi:MAG: hypothetical protein IT419_11130 [Planctomycetes bacterium]|nr:hypothetical protein [Planctomycetota bacterium]